MSFLSAVISQFALEDKVVSIEPLGSGHINDSFLVTTTPEASPDYVLQRINHKIFTDIEALTENIFRVTSYLRERLLSDVNAPEAFHVIQLVRTTSGRLYFNDRDGNYWRMFDHVRGSISYDRVLNIDLAREGGRAFGFFQYLSSGMDASSLHEILPGFHNIAGRLSTFRETVKSDPAGRVGEVKKEIAFVEDRSEEMHTILRLGEEGRIPVRVTHNDTKFNNILFNPAGKAISVVDLDTVMPGYVLYDFGDAIRTGASTAAEDERDLSRVDIDMALFKAYSKGYLETAGGFLNPAETSHLAFSAKFMTYLIGLRFLTDHIDGDHYYKTGFLGHNLQRARTQFKLLESMDRNYQEMQEIIRGCY